MQTIWYTLPFTSSSVMSHLIEIDFLPFTCSDCQKTFCKLHRFQDAHKCTALAPEKYNTLPKCPICQKYVLIKSGESPDRKVSLHIESGCTQLSMHTLFQISTSSVWCFYRYVIDYKLQKQAACSYSKCKALSAPCECKHCHKFFCPQLNIPIHICILHRFELIM